MKKKLDEIILEIKNNKNMSTSQFFKLKDKYKINYDDIYRYNLISTIFYYNFYLFEQLTHDRTDIDILPLYNICKDNNDIDYFLNYIENNNHRKRFYCYNYENFDNISLRKIFNKYNHYTIFSKKDMISNGKQSFLYNFLKKDFNYAINNIRIDKNDLYELIAIFYIIDNNYKKFQEYYKKLVKNEEDIHNINDIFISISEYCNSIDIEFIELYLSNVNEYNQGVTIKSMFLDRLCYNPKDLLKILNYISYDEMKIMIEGYLTNYKEQILNDIYQGAISELFNNITFESRENNFLDNFIKYNKYFNIYKEYLSQLNDKEQFEFLKLIKISRIENNFNTFKKELNNKYKNDIKVILDNIDI